MENNNQIEDLHFDISARVIRQLGEQLVTDEITAVMELVKNAYDADADWVKISIHTDEQDSRIVIEDNGEGMDYDDIKRGWLYVSISSKKEFRQQRKITTKKRAPLGEKGLGRLSVQRLGQRLELITGKLGENVGHSLALNWEDFDNETILESVPIRYERTNKRVDEKGTKLIIKELSNESVWKKDGIDIFRSQISQMLFPIKEKRPFVVSLEFNGTPLDIDELNIKIRKTAIGKFNFSFDGQNLNISGEIKLAKLKANKAELFLNLVQKDNGEQFFHFLTDNKINRSNSLSNLKFKNGEKGLFVTFSKTYNWLEDFGGKLEGKSKKKQKNEPKAHNIIDYDRQELVFANPGSFSGEIDEYALNQKLDEDSEVDFTLGLSEYKNIIQNQIGIRIFRDGFGIKPFGFKKNDWLNLGGGQTSGNSFYGLRPNNVIGYVSLSVYDNINLIEKTDREGFIDSPYSKNFFELMYKVIDEINYTYEKIRRSYISFGKTVAEEKGNIKSTKDSALRATTVATSAAELQVQVDSITSHHSATQQEVNEEVNRIQGNPLLVKELETQFLPLLKKIQFSFEASEALIKKLNGILPIAIQLKYDAEFLISKINELENQLVDFSELAGLGLTSEALSHELLNILDRVSAQTDHLSGRMNNMKDIDTAFYVYIEQIKTFVKNIRIQVNHLAPSLKYNREQKHDINLEAFVKDLKTYFENRFVAQGVEFAIESRQNFSIRMNVGKLTQVFDNLILNSEYWLREKAKTDAAFKPKITIEIEDPLVRIFDNGNGISLDIEGAVFQPFVTTKPRDVGRGLGLFITQQVIEAQGGEIYLLLQRNAAGRRYIFQMNLDSIKK